MQRQRHACTGRHARRGTGGDSTGREQGGIQSGDGGSTREERSVEGGDMGSTTVVGDVEGEGVVTTGGEGGVGGIQYSDADSEEEERVRKFCTEECGCALVNSSPCSTQFTIKHFREMRSNAAELSWSEQNMCHGSNHGFHLLRFYTSELLQAPSQTEDHGTQLYIISQSWAASVQEDLIGPTQDWEGSVQNLRSRYLSNGLVPRLHGHRSCSSKRSKYGSCSEHYCICNAIC